MSSMAKLSLFVSAVLTLTSTLTAIGGLAWGQVVPINAGYEVRVSDYFGQLREDGYVPLRFTINRMGQVVNQAETLFAGAISRRYNRGGESARDVSVRIDFEPGQTTATVDVNIPFYGYYGSQYAVVSRDGSMASSQRRDLIANVRLPDWLGLQQWRNSTVEPEGLTIGLFSGNPTFDSGWHFYAYKMTDGTFMAGPVLVPEVKALPNVAAPQFAALVDILKNNVSRQAQSHTLPTPTNPDYRAAMEHRYLVSGDLTSIPETWMGLTRLDIALLSVADLQVLANRYPSRLEAVRLWLVNGGRLIVFDCGADFRGLPSILPNLTAAAATRPLPNQPWSIPDANFLDQLQAGYLRTAERYTADLETENQQAAFRAASQKANPIRSWMLEQNALKDSRRLSGAGATVARQAAAEKAELLITSYGTGRIVATAGDVTQFDRFDWAKILMAACGSEQPFPYEGIGQYNHKWEGYSDFEVANVGNPPWAMFLVLITMFALLVGPIAFAILKRMERTHLLLAVVPIFALLVTAGIVCYSIIQDGVGFRTARISVTWLDSQHQTALVQTNQAIYAGLAPGRLEFSTQTPYFDNSSQMEYNTGRLRIYSADNKQTVSGGRILARTKHQVINFNVVGTAARVVVEGSGSEGSGSDGSWSVINQLGFDAQMLIVCTDDGMLIASQVADGAQAELTTDLSELDLWRTEFRSAGRNGQAVPKLVLDNASSNSAREVGRIGNVFSTVTATGQPLRPGEFVAISRQQPLAQSLHPYAQQDEELHLTIGSYLRGRPRSPAAAAEVPSE